MEHINCPVCGEARYRVLSVRGCTPESRRTVGWQPVSVVSCEACGHMYVNPRSDAAELRHFYEVEFKKQWQKPVPGSPAWEKDMDAERRSAERKMAFLRPHLDFPGRRVLHVRSEAGHFLDLVRKAGGTGRGIAIEDYYAEYDRKAFGGEVSVTKIYQWEWPDDEQYDLIVAHHTLEHIPNPTALLEGMLARLAPQGMILIEEHDKLTRGLRDLSGRPEWHLFNVHLHNFTAPALKGYLEACGLDIIASQADPDEDGLPVYFLGRRATRPRVERPKLGDAAQLERRFRQWRRRAFWQYDVKGLIKRLVGRT